MNFANLKPDNYLVDLKLYCALCSRELLTQHEINVGICDKCREREKGESDD